MEDKKKRKIPKWLIWFLAIAVVVAVGYWYFYMR
jgi:hypothetical protein